MIGILNFGRFQIADRQLSRIQRYANFVKDVGGKATFRVGGFSFVDLRALSRFVLRFELPSESVTASFGHFSRVVDIEEETAEEDDVGDCAQGGVSQSVRTSVMSEAHDFEDTELELERSRRM